MKTSEKETFLSYAIGNFFDTFLVFWLSFLIVGLFAFIDKIPSTQDMPLPDMWMFVYEHIFLFSQWFVPVLLVAFGVNAFFHKRLISRVMQKVIHAWILDSTAIIAGALLGSTYLNEGHIFFLDITLDNQLTIVAFSFMVYAASILTISMLTYVIHRMTRPNLEPVNDPLPSQT
jgi:hypothetical protein